MKPITGKVTYFDIREKNIELLFKEFCRYFIIFTFYSELKTLLGDEIHHYSFL